MRISQVVRCGWVFCISAAMVSSAHAAPSQPNIVVMLVDDMGIMDTSVPLLTDEGEAAPRIR
jgi:hypothetical protein